MDVWVGPVVHKTIRRFYMYWFGSPPPGGVMGLIWTSVDF